MIKRIIGPGFLAAFVMLLIGYLNGQVFNSIFPSLVSEFQNTNLFRGVKDPEMIWYFIHPFVLGITLAWVWIKVKDTFKSFSVLQSGIRFGFAYWLLSVSGMISYSSFQLSALMIVSWTVGLLLESLACGVLLAKLNPAHKTS